MNRVGFVLVLFCFEWRASRWTFENYEIVRPGFEENFGSSCFGSFGKTPKPTSMAVTSPHSSVCSFTGHSKKHSLHAPKNTALVDWQTKIDSPKVCMSTCCWVLGVNFVSESFGSTKVCSRTRHAICQITVFCKCCLLTYKDASHCRRPQGHNWNGSCWWGRWMTIWQCLNRSCGDFKFCHLHARESSSLNRCTNLPCTYDLILDYQSSKSHLSCFMVHPVRFLSFLY